MPSRFLRWGAVLAGTLVLFCAIWMWKIAWRSPAPYEPEERVWLRSPIMSATEYDVVLATHPRPAVYRVRAEKGEALVFGAEHTKDPESRQLAELRRSFLEFSPTPTVVLVEGRPGSPLGGLGDPVRRFGEEGLAISLARAEGMPVWSWEPSRDDEVRAILRDFPRKRVALFTYCGRT